MYIVVHHDISNTEDFWASAQRNLPKLPEAGVKRVVSVFPTKRWINVPAYGKLTPLKTWKNTFGRRWVMLAAIPVTK
jgi:hypothetical protein